MGAGSVPKPGDTTKSRMQAKPVQGMDTFRISKDAIDQVIEYKAEDSTYFNIASRKAYLWGKANVIYDGLNLKADIIIVDFGTRQLYARGRIDSTGKYVGRPLFNDGERETEADTMIYNFDTKRGRTYGIALKEDESYIYCNKVFRDDDKSIYSDEGKYTTCNNQAHPHFYLQARKLKIIPEKKIIFGPSNLVIEDIPTPLFIPFGMFPLKKDRKAGLLPFDYGMSGNYGPYMRGVGYYIPVSDYLDLVLSGDIYFRGSWRANASTRYAKRYKYTGSFSIEFSKYLNGEREDPNFKTNISRTFALKWSHSQDAKARPGSTFSANVDIQKNNAAQLNSRNATNIVRNEFGSSVTYTKSVLKNKASVSISALHRQNSQTHFFTMTLPNLTFNLQRINPFSKPNALGKYKWYKDVGFSYQMQFENRIETKDSVFFSGKPIEGAIREFFPQFRINSPINLTSADQFKQGILHSVPITLGSYKFLHQHFVFTPTVTYNEYWYFRTMEKRWNAAEKKEDTMYHDNFSRASDYSATGGIATQVYSTAQFGHGKIGAIRHTLAPTLGFNYRPDFGKEKFGYYKEVQSDTAGHTEKYSIYQGGIKGFPTSGPRGALTFQFNNNIQAKVLKKTDTSSKYETKTWLENLTVSGDYNFLADTMKLSNITVTGFTKLYKLISLTGNATLNPYTKNGNTYVNKLEWNNSHRIGTWTNGTVSMNTALNADMFRKKKNLDTAGKTKSKDDQDVIADIQKYPDQYVNFTIPWTININYSFNYSRINYQAKYGQTFNISGDLRISPKWKVDYTTGYDFASKKIAYTQFGVSRLLHCWALNFTWIPDGIRKSFNFSIHANSSLLSSLKVEKKRNWFDQ